ncbi:type I restriction enzyme S subunit [Rhodanobacter sp. TND4EL1]
MSELPGGWVFASLGDLQTNVGIFSDGDWIESKDQDPEGQNRLLQLADIGDGTFINKSSRFVNDETFERLNCTALEEGDVLIARMPDPLGRACLMPNLPQRCLTVVDVAVFRSGHADISHRWLMHAINASPIREDISRNASGTTRKRIARGKLSELIFPVPPAAEQKRIAQKLDELLAQVNTLKARIDAIPALVKRFRQCVLASALSGKLTGISVEVDAALADTGNVTGGITKNSKRSSLELVRPYLRVANVQAGRLDLREITSIGVTDQEAKKTELKSGDILIVEGNGSLDHIGRAAMWSGEIKNCCHQNHLIRWRQEGQALPKFVLFYLASPQGREALVKAAKSTTGLHTLSITKISSLRIPLLELEQQTEIVRRVEQLFDFADQLEAKVVTVKQRIDTLTQSILAKAFRGELVPQDPNDEPASVLLERIRAQRAAAPKPKRGRKTKG